MEGSRNRPVQTYRLLGVSASIFRNSGKGKRDNRDVSFFKVTLQKTYHDGTELKNTTSLGRDDLPIAAHLLQKSWEYIVETESGTQERA